MAANVIVFDASTDSEEDTPVVLASEKRISDSSDSDSTPVIKKTRSTRTRCSNQSRPPLGDVSNDAPPSVAIYTKTVSCLFSQVYPLIPDADLEDEDEDDKVVKRDVKKGQKKTTQRPSRVKDPDVLEINSDSPSNSQSQGSNRDRSPTPPPSGAPRLPVRKRRKPRTPKSTKQAIGNLESLRGRLQRRNDFYDEVNDEDVIILDDPELPSVSPEKLFDIKIRSAARGIHRIPMKRTGSFENVLKVLAEIEDVPVEQILLYHNDHIIQPYDSPQTLHITVADILDCHKRVPEDHEDEQEDSLLEDLEDPSMVRLKLQGRHKRTASVTLRINRSDPLEKLMREYALKCGLCFEQLKFQFDGEAVQRRDTADGLEMEDDDCIDVST